MTTAFTGNVILTTSKVVIDKIFFSRTNKPFHRLVGQLTESEFQNSIIASPYNNSNLISFDYNFNGDQRSGHILTIRFVETGSLFEEYYLNKDYDVKVASEILQDISNKKNKKYTDREKTAIESSFINKTKLVTSDYIYFSFGVGPNLDDWAGPYMGNLIQAEMFIGENGIREIEMKFGVQPGFLMRNIIESNRAKQFETAINRYEFITSRQIKSPNLSRVQVSANYNSLDLNLSSVLPTMAGVARTAEQKGLPVPQAYANQEYFKRIEIEDDLRLKKYLEGIKPEINSFAKQVQLNVKFLISNYIKSITDKTNSQQNNVIVLLPDMSEALTKELIDYLYNSKLPVYLEEAVFGASNLPNIQKAKYGFSNLSPQDKKIIVFNKYLLACRDIIIKYTSFFCQVVMSKSLDSFNVEFNFIKGRNIDSQSQLERRIAEEKRNGITTKDGISFIGSNAYDVLSEIYSKEKEEANKKNQSIDYTVDGKGTGIDIFCKYIRLHGFEIGIELDSNNKDRSLETTPDYYIPLAKFNKAISEIFSKVNYSYDPIFQVENDLRLLSLWKKLDIITDDSKPVYIFGDSNLIQKLIYLSDVRTVEDTLKKPQGPIHPDDMSLFGSPEYRSLLNTIFNTMSFNSSFNEDVFVKDELAIFEDSQIKALVSVGRYPVFRYNVRNSNVLAVSFKNLNAYRAVYDIGFQYKSLLPFINSTSKFYLDSLSSTDIKNFDELVKLTESTLFFSGLANPINGDFKDLLNSVLTIVETKSGSDNYGNPISIDFFMTDKFGTPISKQDLSTFIAASIFRKYNAPDVPYIDIKDAKQLPVLEEELRRGLFRFTNFLDIRTVPFFKLSGTKAFSYPALFVGMSNGAGTNEKKPAFFTGLYQINGFRHIINTKEMYSEFSLIKNADSSIFNNVLDENLNKVNAELALDPKTNKP